MYSHFSSVIVDALSLLGWQDDVATPVAADPGSFVQRLLSPTNLILLSLILFFVLVIRPQKNEMKRMQQLVAGLKKNDRVVTSGGIHGVVIQANAGDATIVIRIDENSGARMTVNRDAISKVLNADADAEKKS